MVSVGADGDFEGALDGSDFGFSVEEVSSSSSFSVSSGNPVGDADDRYHARMRKYSVIPSSEGSGTEHYEYNATLRAKSEIVVGVATSGDNWKTITFIEEE